MKKYLSIYLLFTIATMGLIILGLQATPSYLMKERNALYLKEAGDLNKFYHQNLPDAEFDAFVSPSPDLLYSYLVFDVSRAALLVEFPIHNDFWVNQMVADNTDSFAYVGYKNQSSHPVKFVLFNGESPRFETPQDTISIETPSDKGTFLLRYLVRDKNDLQRIDDKRREVKVIELN